MTKKFTRAELLDLVWSAPLSKLTADLGFASPTIKNAALKAGIPTPLQGHWHRVAAGKNVDPKPALPLRGFGASDDIFIGGTYWNPPSPKLDDPIPPPPVFDEPIDAVHRRAVKAIGRIDVARDLSRSHLAISEILRYEHLRAEKIKSADYVFS